MDSFVKLSMKKEFKDITIKDITTKADVNRSTFYSHFIDKYDLLEKVLNENIMKEVIEEVNSHQKINEDTIESIFSSIVRLKKTISSTCYRSYSEYSKKMENILKNELQSFFIRCGEKEWPNQEKQKIEIFAVMLSWALYGSVVHFMEKENKDYKNYIKQLIGFVELHKLNCNEVS